jgi:serine/threonine protein kinase
VGIQQDKLIGQNLSRYAILECLGAGGMGTVYRARDTLLDRIVAVKLLNLDPAISKEQIERFFREARVTSALNHPNICTLFDFIQDGGRFFIIMEFLQGESLREVLNREGSLPLHRVIEILLPVCSALQAAHDKGIVHRDVKPANIIITQDGTVKVLDFGLAKLRSDSPEPGQCSQREKNPPVSIRTSFSGLSGTASYMSPEQIRGEAVDGRSDIFSMGIILQELLTGNTPFAGEDAWEVMQNILQKEPEPVTLDNKKEIRRARAVLAKALQKERDKRWRTCNELAMALASLVDQRWQRMLWALAALMLATLFSLWILIRPNSPMEAPVFKYTPLGYISSSASCPSFSADGRVLAFNNWNYAIDKGESITLMAWPERTIIRHYDLYSKNIDLSPDGMRLVGDFPPYFKIFDTAMKSEATLPFRGRDPDWSPDGRSIAYSDHAETAHAEQPAIHVYDTIGHTTRQLSPQDGQGYAHPVWSGDGRMILCTRGLGSIHELCLIDVLAGDCKTISNFKSWCWYPAFSPDGQYIYYVSNARGANDLYKIAFDSKHHRLGKSHQLSSGVGFSSFALHPSRNEIVFDKIVSQCRLDIAPLTPDGAIDWYQQKTVVYLHQAIENMELSPDGQVVLLEGNQAGLRAILIYDLENGKEIWRYAGQSPFAPSWFPDGRWIAFDAGGGDQADIWRINWHTNQLEKIIEHPGADWGPTVSPDGAWICFTSNRSGTLQLWLQHLDSRQVQQITHSGCPRSRGFWSPDGRKIAFWEAGASDSLYICCLDLSSQKNERIFIHQYHDQLFYKQLLWNETDDKIFFRHCGILVQLSLRDNSIATKNLPEESQAVWSFALDNHAFYGIYQDISTELWLAEFEE